MADAQPGPKLLDPIDQRLLGSRIVFLDSEVTEESATSIVKRLLVLSADDPKKDIWLYIASPGGSVDAGLSIYDVMRLIPNDVATLAYGMAASMAQFLLSAGTPGKRYALPHSRILMHQVSGGIGGTASDIRIQAEQSIHLKRLTTELNAKHTGKTVEQIEADSDRDAWYTATEALDYGFIDHVIASMDDITATPRSGNLTWTSDLVARRSDESSAGSTSVPATGSTGVSTTGSAEGEVSR